MNTQINYLVAIKLISVKDFVNLSPLIVNFNSFFFYLKTGDGTTQRYLRNDIPLPTCLDDIREII